MPLNEQVPTMAATTGTAVEGAKTTESTDAATVDNTSQNERQEKLLKAKELYSIGSRNFLIKNYAEAADELSHVCSLFAELHGELADELGMPYLLYAKSLIALSLDENKVIDVPDEEEDDDDEEEEGEDTNGNEVSEEAACKENGESAGTKTVAKNGEADSTAEEAAKVQNASAAKQSEKNAEDGQVSSSVDNKAAEVSAEVENGKEDSEASSSAVATGVVLDDEKPSTSNGKAVGATVELTTDDDEDNEAASNLQLAWEILEMAAKIFTRQGENGLPNLAEVQTELGNIQFENSILDAARDDYQKALEIYSSLSSKSYRRAMAEIHYKIGLAFLMQQLNKEGAGSLKKACELIQDEIDDIKSKTELDEKDTNNIQDMEETKQEIEAKIVEIEEMQAQQIADVRAALDSYIKPILTQNADSAGPSSSTTSTSAAATTTKPNDISHLIKRKKPDEPSSEAEAAAPSPAKRPTP